MFRFTSLLGRLSAAMSQKPIAAAARTVVTEALESRTLMSGTPLLSHPVIPLPTVQAPTPQILPIRPIVPINPIIGPIINYAPSVTGVDPSPVIYSGTGNVSLTLTGASFNIGSSGLASGDGAAAIELINPDGTTFQELGNSNINTNSPTSIQLATGDFAGEPFGAWGVEVINPDGQASAVYHFNVQPPPPTITAVDPAPIVVNDTGSLEFNIFGSNFALGAIKQLVFTSPTGQKLNETLSIADATATEIQGETPDFVGTAGGQWSAQVINTDGDASNVFHFNVVGNDVSPSIGANPQSQTVNAGSNVTFNVTSTSPLASYQWQFNGDDIAGQYGPSLTLDNVSGSQAGSYDVVVSNAYGSATSGIAKLSVNSPAIVQAPTITTQPQSQSVNQGATVALGVSASNANSYQWQFDGQNISGATGSSLTLSNVSPSQAGNYTVAVSNSGGTTSSNAAQLTVNSPAHVQAPTITTQPQSQSVNQGATVTLGVSASNANSYQWQFDGQNISGATGSSLTLSNVSPSQAGNYTVAVSNSGGTTSSNAAQLTVNSSTLVQAPTITAQPKSQSVKQGDSVTFSLSTNNAASFQWQFNGQNIAGATSPSLTLSNVSPTQAGDYSVVVTNSGGSVTSNAAVLTVSTPAQIVNTIKPTITSQPISQSIGSGGTVAFSVLADNASQYQWLFNGQPIAGATRATLTVPGATSAQAGSYSVIVSNGSGEVTSSNATLTVSPLSFLLSAPASVVAGKKSKAVLTIANTSGLQFKNSVAIELVLSTSTGSLITLTEMTKKINLRPGASANETLRFKAPRLSSGSYTVLAEIGNITTPIAAPSQMRILG